MRFAPEYVRLRNQHRGVSKLPSSRRSEWPAVHPSRAALCLPQDNGSDTTVPQTNVLCPSFVIVCAPLFHAACAPNEVRIVGGTWRSRRIRFPPAADIRPTPDRVRETLFNWLGQDLTGLACLDLFAGSGALGFEAASRGASRVVMVERNRAAYASLLANRTALDATRSRGRADAMRWNSCARIQGSTTSSSSTRRSQAGMLRACCRSCPPA